MKPYFAQFLSPPVHMHGCSSKVRLGHTSKSLKYCHMTGKRGVIQYGQGKHGFLSPPVQVARWALMRHFLSVRLSVRTGPKIGENNSYLERYTGSR